MERKWVVASFLDLTGFRSWTYRAATSPEDKENFIDAFYKVLQCYVKNHPDVWAKYEGDGILCVKEFTAQEKKAHRPIFNFIDGLRTLLRKVRKVLDSAESAPRDVRIRLIDGYVYKLMVIDPNDPSRSRTIAEYLEYCTNTARGLLEVNPEIPCLATKSLVENLGRFRSSFRVRKLGKPSKYPKGVNLEDVETLYVLRF